MSPLTKAVRLLNDNNRIDFYNFVNTKTAFNPHNMFKYRSKEILKDYYKTVFLGLNIVKKNLDFKIYKDINKQEFVVSLRKDLCLIDFKKILIQNYANNFLWYY